MPEPATIPQCKKKPQDFRLVDRVIKPGVSSCFDLDAVCEVFTPSQARVIQQRLVVSNLTHHATLNTWLSRLLKENFHASTQLAATLFHAGTFLTFFRRSQSRTTQPFQSI